MTANRVCMIDMPGLSPALMKSIPPASALGRWMQSRAVTPLTPSFPAVTCSVQATLTTGVPPARHGILANGMPTFRSPQDQSLVDASNFSTFRKQISFWEQSNQFLDAPRFWQDADGKSKYKTALLFFQNSMPGFSGALRPAADIVLTPKPDHGPDGKLTSLCWSEPRDLVPQLFAQFGPFPLMNYWGPMAAIASSQWIAKASAWIWSHQSPALQLVYIPHLDYDLQRFGPSSPQARQAVRDAADAVDPLVSSVLDSGGKLVLLSEYAMTDVTASLSPNRILAEAGLLVTRPTPDGNLIDYEQSSALALVDHQIAQIYCRADKSAAKARKILEAQPLLSVATSKELGITHRRAGELVLRAAPQTWLDYRWWSDPAAAPSFAKMVDIHRKPGYDPLELFWDRAAGGVSQDLSLIHGSHGLASAGQAVCISDDATKSEINATEIAALIQSLLS